MSTKFKNRKGMTLIITIIMVMVLTILGVSILSIAISNGKNYIMKRNSIQAKYVSLAGADMAIKYISGDKVYSDSIGNDLGYYYYNNRTFLDNMNIPMLTLPVETELNAPDPIQEDITDEYKEMDITFYLNQSYPIIDNETPGVYPYIDENGNEIIGVNRIRMKAEAANIPTSLSPPLTEITGDFGQADVSITILNYPIQYDTQEIKYRIKSVGTFNNGYATTTVDITQKIDQLGNNVNDRTFYNHDIPTVITTPLVTLPHAYDGYKSFSDYVGGQSSVAGFYSTLYGSDGNNLTEMNVTLDSINNNLSDTTKYFLYSGGVIPQNAKINLGNVDSGDALLVVPGSITFSLGNTIKSIGSRILIVAAQDIIIDDPKIFKNNKVIFYGNVTVNLSDSEYFHLNAHIRGNLTINGSSISKPLIFNGALASQHKIYGTAATNLIASYYPVSKNHQYFFEPIAPSQTFKSTFEIGKYS